MHARPCAGPHNGGSPPCDHSSMRWANFGNSLWYADALASKAWNGYAGLCRQDYIGADYGMVDCQVWRGRLPLGQSDVERFCQLGGAVLSVEPPSVHTAALAAWS
jgi:hypothetical protein